MLSCSRASAATTATPGGAPAARPGRAGPAASRPRRDRRRPPSAQRPGEVAAHHADQRREPQHQAQHQRRSHPLPCSVCCTVLASTTGSLTAFSSAFSWTWSTSGSGRPPGSGPGRAGRRPGRPPALEAQLGAARRELRCPLLGSLGARRQRPRGPSTSAAPAAATEPAPPASCARGPGHAPARGTPGQDCRARRRDARAPPASAAVAPASFRRARRRSALEPTPTFGDPAARRRVRVPGGVEPRAEPVPTARSGRSTTSRTVGDLTRQLTVGPGHRPRTGGVPRRAAGDLPAAPEPRRRRRPACRALPAQRRGAPIELAGCRRPAPDGALGHVAGAGGHRPRWPSASRPAPEASSARLEASGSIPSSS